jgi:alkyl hydroperoxide reductase subunit AhpC
MKEFNKLRKQAEKLMKRAETNISLISVDHKFSHHRFTEIICFFPNINKS